MAMNKPSKELVVDLINQDTGRNFAYDEVTFDNPTAVSIHGKNTEVVVRGVLDAGYTGAKVLHYDRLHLATAMPPVEPEGVEVMVPNDGFIDTGEITERLNRMYGLQLAPEDLVNQELTIGSLPMSLQLQANPLSLAWRGAMDIQLVQDRPMFQDAVLDPNLDGFDTPDADVSQLTDPAVTTNSQHTFRTGGDLLLTTAAEPSQSFLVCHNSELELAGCARRELGTVVQAPDGDGAYSLALNAAATWSVMLSVGLLGEPATRITDLYAVCVFVQCPDDSTLMFRLQYNEGQSQYELFAEDHSLTIPVDYGAANGSVVQHRLDMAQIKPALGTILSSSGGAPLGLYTIRLQARRLDSMTPRVLSTFLVKANNAT